jgi:hypothetical protein
MATKTNTNWGNKGRIPVTRTLALIASAAVLAFAVADTASAATCSSWRAACVKRSKSFNPQYLPECDAKFNACLSSGCFTEGASFGGASHCGLAKK